VGKTDPQRMAEPHEVSHLEIYRLLIEVKTTLDMALKQRAEDKDREDKEKVDIFKRLNALESKTALWAGVAIACSFVIPLLVTAAAPKLHFQSTPSAVASPR
jgi:hypothetical protein